MRTLLCLVLFAFTSTLHAQPVFRAGAATSNITPNLGGDIIGGFLPFPATHIHDELHARCLVLDDGTTKLALVVCDLLGIGRNVSDEARALIKEQLGIPIDNVLISGTHTHSATSALGKDARLLNQEMDEYQRFVARRIVDGVRRAHNQLRPAQFAMGSVSVPDHVFNRRWHMKPGSVPPNPFGGIDKVKMNPPAGSADLLEPAGPTDPDIPILSFKGTDGKWIGVFTAYSLHYVGGVGNGHISADYFGMYCDALAKRLKADDLVVLMANGTSGDINNINFKQPRGKREPYQQMRFVAEDVADKVFAGLTNLKFRTDVTLAARYRELPVGTRRPDAKLIEWAKAKVAEPKVKGGKADLSVIYAGRALRMADHPEKLKTPLQTLRIGEVSIGTMPCEIFCEIGLDYKKRNGKQPAFLVSLNHGYFGYLPTPRQHELGGYETWLGTNRLEVQASDRMLDALMEMTNEMRK